jgi:K+-transporting ATPase ATPase A chain
MVGRTPEYVGKKIEAGGQAGDARHPLPAARHARLHGHRRGAAGGRVVAVEQGPHGFSEILYAYTSAAANNGSAFAGLTANTPWYNITLGIAMLMGRFLMIIPALAIAGSLAPRRPFRPRRHASRPTARCSSGLLARRHPHRRRPDLLPGACARSDRRALRHAGNGQTSSE